MVNIYIQCIKYKYIFKKEKLGLQIKKNNKKMIDRYVCFFAR